MGVNDNVIPTTVASKPANTQQDVRTKPQATENTAQDLGNKQENRMSLVKNQLSEDDWKEVTDNLNEFLQSMNTDIKIVLHSKTNTLMVQVQEGKTHKVLKECPAHELLDTVARIKDCIGAFLDKKA